jgi:reticulon-4-interacting protein 1, mitochondrial
MFQFSSRPDGLESLSIRSDFERPRIESPDQVLVRIHAASVDPVDVLILSGTGRNERDASADSVVLGRDFSGVVVEVGLHVEEFKIGDGVWSAVPVAANGCLAEYVVLPVDQVSP